MDTPTSHRFSVRFFATLLLSGAILTILLGLASVWFLRNLGEILGALSPSFGLPTDTAETLSAIFAQLKIASLDLPLEIMGLFCFLYCGLSIVYIHAGTSPWKRRLLVILVGILLFLPLFAVTVWFTDVNDIRFDHVITSLRPLLDAGVL